MKKILCLSLFLLSTQLPFSVYATNNNALHSSLTSDGIPSSSLQRSTLDNDFNSLLKEDESLKTNSKVLMSLGNAFTQDLSESRRVSTSIVQEGLKILQNTEDAYDQFNKALMKEKDISYSEKLKIFEIILKKCMKEAEEQAKSISKIVRERKKIENESFEQGLAQIYQAGQEYLKMRKEAANSFLNELKIKNEAFTLEFEREEKEAKKKLAFFKKKSEEEFEREEKEALKKQAFFKKKREEDLALLSEENRANLAHQKNELELEKKIEKEEEHPQAKNRIHPLKQKQLELNKRKKYKKKKSVNKRRMKSML